VPAANRIGVAMTAIGVVATVAAALAVPIVVLWNADTDETSTAFTSTPQFLLWMLLLSAQAAVWVPALWYIGKVIVLRRGEVNASRAPTSRVTLKIAGPGGCTRRAGRRIRPASPA